MFGQIKQGRGFQQFLLRGLEKVNGEWSLICAGHNLLKLFRSGAGSNVKRLPGNGGNPASACQRLLTVVRRRYRLLPPASTIAVCCSSLTPP